MDAPATTESPRCPKCGSDQIDTDKFGALCGWKAVLFFAFAVCFVAATIVALAVEMSALPAESPDWLRAVANYLADSGLGRFILLSGVGLVVFAYVCLEGNADVLSGVAKLLGSPEHRCRLCGHRWPKA